MTNEQQWRWANAYDDRKFKRNGGTEMQKQEPIIFKTEHRDYRVHQLKIVEPYFSDVKNGLKTFEVRKFDRDFQIGDFLVLTLYDPKTNQLGESIVKQITYMLTAKPYVPDGYVILGIVDAEISIPF
jgi:Domain of unknown function (DUF3850)